MKGGRNRKLGDCLQPQLVAEAEFGRKGESGHFGDKNKWEYGVWKLMRCGRGSHVKESKMGVASYAWPTRRLLMLLTEI